jgi:Na+(H+)/acetate symporter ActP
VAPFDPVGLTTDYNRQAEVRNARLAMLATLGFAVQAFVTGKGPLENAQDHLRDPFGANIFTYEKGPAVVGIFLAFAVAMHLAELSRSKAAAKTSSSFT